MQHRMTRKYNCKMSDETGEQNLLDINGGFIKLNSRRCSVSRLILLYNMMESQQVKLNYVAVKLITSKRTQKTKVNSRTCNLQERKMKSHANLMADFTSYITLFIAPALHTCPMSILYKTKMHSNFLLALSI